MREFVDRLVVPLVQGYRVSEIAAGGMQVRREAFERERVGSALNVPLGR